MSDWTYAELPKAAANQALALAKTSKSAFGLEQVLAAAEIYRRALIAGVDDAAISHALEIAAHETAETHVEMAKKISVWLNQNAAAS